MGNDATIYAIALGAGNTDAFARLMAAQARLESGNYTNAATTVDNNPWARDYQANDNWATGPGSTYNNDNPASPVAFAHYPSISAAASSQLDYFNNLINTSLDYDTSEMQTPQGYNNQLIANGYYAGGAATQQDYVSQLSQLANQLDLSNVAVSQPAPAGGGGLSLSQPGDTAGGGSPGLLTGGEISGAVAATLLVILIFNR